MISYLQGGWYSGKQRARLRTQVIDGAMDAAGALVRAGVPPHRIMRLALKVRSLVVITDPLFGGSPDLGPARRARLADRLALHTDGFPELQAFINDCLEHVRDTAEMTAFYLHLLHVGRMMQLLGAAVGSGLAGLALPPPAKRRPAATRPGTKRKAAATRRRKSAKRR